MNSYIQYARNLVVKRRKPLSLVYFVTHRCNLRCRHCFFLKELDQPVAELTLPEIDRFTKSIGSFLSLSLTGGEPFIREDLAEIVQLFHKNCSIRNLNIPTNGQLTQQIVAGTRKILESCPGLAFNLAMSLDGPREMHDSMRNRQGAFDKAIETYRAIRELQRSYPRLNTEIITVISAHNQDRLEEFYDYVFTELKPDSVNLSPVRGGVSDATLKDFDLARYEQLIGRLQKAFVEQRVSGYANFSCSEYVLATRLIIPGIISRILRRNVYQTACYAGVLSGVLYASGDVYPCELLDRKIGNLRDYNMDFMALWNSPQATEIIKHIKQTRCFCIHPCNFTVNILFNARYIPRLLAGAVRLRLRRMRRSAS